MASRRLKNGYLQAAERRLTPSHIGSCRVPCGRGTEDPGETAKSPAAGLASAAGTFSAAVALCCTRGVLVRLRGGGTGVRQAVPACGSARLRAFSPEHVGRRASLRNIYVYHGVVYGVCTEHVRSTCMQAGLRLGGTIIRGQTRQRTAAAGRGEFQELNCRNSPEKLAGVCARGDVGITTAEYSVLRGQGTDLPAR